MLVTNRASRRLSCLLCEIPIQKGEYKVSETSSSKTFCSYHEKCFLERVKEITRINKMESRLEVIITHK